MSAHGTCLVCRRCLCPRHHPKDPCEPIDRGRRIFLLGALMAPVAAKLVKPAQAQAQVITFSQVGVKPNGHPIIARMSWSAPAPTDPLAFAAELGRACAQGADLLIVAALSPGVDVVLLEGSYVGAAPKALTESTDAVRFPGLGEHSSSFASSIEGRGGRP